jgi:hypothetical protein
MKPMIAGENHWHEMQPRSKRGEEKILLKINIDHLPKEI